jgi:excisionase family DNA binding protein
MGAAEKHDDEVWLTTKEAAKYVKMHKRTLLDHISKGTLKPDSRARPGFKVHRFRRESLDRWLEGK